MIISRGYQIPVSDAVCVEERKLGYEKGDLLFPNGQVLFYQALVGSLNEFRSKAVDDFGILPFPKYDEGQNTYNNLCSQGWASCVYIPVTCSDTERAGYVLDTMGAYSVDTVTEAVIENNIFVKGIRDETSGEMLRIILNAKYFDASCVYDWGVYSIWCDATNAKDIASKLQKGVNSTSKKIQNTFDKLNESIG